VRRADFEGLLPRSRPARFGAASGGRPSLVDGRAPRPRRLVATRARRRAAHHPLAAPAAADLRGYRPSVRGSRPNVGTLELGRIEGVSGRAASSRRAPRGARADPRPSESGGNEVRAAPRGERVDGRGHDGEADEEQLAAVEERLDEEPHLREALERPQGPQEPHDAQRAQRHVRLLFRRHPQRLQDDRNGVRVDALGDDRGVDEVPGVVEVRAAPGRDLDEELEEEEDEERELEAALPRVVFGLVLHRRGEREEHRVDDDREEHAAVERPRRREPLEPPGLLFALRVVHFVERWRNAGDRWEASRQSFRRATS